MHRPRANLDADKDKSNQRADPSRRTPSFQDCEYSLSGFQEASHWRLTEQDDITAEWDENPGIVTQTVVLMTAEPYHRRGLCGMGAVWNEAAQDPPWMIRRHLWNLL